MDRVVRVIDIERDPDAPAARVDEVTQPLEHDHEHGPGYAQLVQLDRGEIESLRFAGQYQLDRRLGRGGMAFVFGGEHLESGLPVAVKILLEDHSNHDQSLARFLREARMGALIHHPNVIETFTYGSTPEGLIYLVMERLEGQDLGRLIAEHDGLPWARVRSVMLQICAGLGEIHSLGFVHRDVKPSNVFSIVTNGHETIKLLDFGIATRLDDTIDDVSIDDPSSVIGTPRYMSPEQARGEPIDARSDVYSAGILLCELLTGKVPFSSELPLKVIDAQIHDAPPELRRLAPEGARIESSIQRVYARALAKDPNQRFANIGEMAAAIRAIKHHRTWRDLVAALLASVGGIYAHASKRVAERRQVRREGSSAR